MKERVSNFEVLRILSMLMIVFLHVKAHYITGDESLYQLPHAFMYLQTLSMICVNLFIVISGYFMVTSTRKMTHWFKLFFQVSFFAVIISGVMFLLGIQPITIKSLFQNILPILLDRYWFITMYAILYLLVPYLNFFLNQTSKDTAFSLIFILFVIGSIWEPITGIENMGFGSGYGLSSFIFLYLIGGYIRKYDSLAIHFKQRWSYFALFFGLGAYSAVMYQFTENPMFIHYNHWTTVLMTYGLFMGLKTMKPFVNKPLNYVAKHVFGVYLVHEHPMVRQLLHDSALVDRILSLNAPYFTLRAIGFALMIFGISWGIATVLNTVYNAMFGWIHPKISNAWHAWIED